MSALHPIEAHRRELLAKNPRADLTLITHKDDSIEWVDDSYFENKPKREISITPADEAAFDKYLAEKEAADAHNLKFDMTALAALRAACRSLASISSHEIPAEYVASAAAYFGEAGLPVLREYVESTCPPDLDVDFIAGDLWCEACAQRGETFEDWEKASDEPGGWRWLVQHVRQLEGGGEPPEPSKPIQVGTVPEASHLTTDQMNAARLAAHYGGTQLIASAGSFYRWTGTHWERDPSGATLYGAQLSSIVGEEAKVQRAKFESMAALNPDGKKLEATVRRDKSKLEDNLRATADGLAMVNALYRAEALEKWQKSCEMRTNINNALALLLDLLTVDPENFDLNPALFNCLNGTLDLRSGRLKPHDPKDLITRCAPVNYLPNAKAPRFKQFMEEILDGERAKFAQSWFGYGLTGEVREQKMIVLIGEGGNGKSTLMELIESVMGGYAHTTPRGFLTAAKGDDRHPTEIADLFRKRLVTTAESEDGSTLREGFVKQATGGDPLTGRHMGKDFFTFQPTHKLQLLTNHKPNIRGNDYGIWRRILLLKFEIKFGTAEDVAAGRATHLRDTTLRDALLAEREGIFAWLVQGAIDWYRDGLQPPASVLEASEAYRMEQDRVGQFVHECCVLEPDTWSPFSGAFIGLYPAYSGWCRESGYQALGMKRFVDELARIVPKFRKAERKLNFDGVRKTVNGAFGVKVNLAGPRDGAANDDLVGGPLI